LEKIFANDIPNNELISKIYEELTQLNTKNETKPRVLLKNGQRN